MSDTRLYIFGGHGAVSGTVGVTTERQRWGWRMSYEAKSGLVLNTFFDCVHYAKLPKKFEDAPIGYKPKRLKIGGKYHYL